MRVLLDTCVWGGARESLQAAGHEVEWAGEWDRDPGDDVILEHALKNGQVLVTLDKDFGELAVVKGTVHRGIVRLVACRAEAQGTLAVAALSKYGDALVAGAIVTIEPSRTRVRPAAE